MKKRNAILALILIIVLIAGGGYMVVNGVGTEGSGSAENINLGLDLAGSANIHYFF